MKTKIIYIIDILWIVGAGLQEGGYLELIPEDKDWLKLVIIAAVLALNAIKIQLEIQEKKAAEQRAEMTERANKFLIDEVNALERGKK